jgi:hypothetical protein
MKPPFPHLHKVLRELNASGDDGFEGLLAVALSAITGCPFRLAGGGLQFGGDGGAEVEGAEVVFEAKRYQGATDNNSIRQKLGQLVSCKLPPDLWMLGSTGTVSKQIHDDIDEALSERGVAHLIIEWSTVGLPRLAVLCASAKTEVLEFLKANAPLSESVLASVDAELVEIEALPEFGDVGGWIIQQLRLASTGGAIALKNNAAFFNRVVEDKREAKAELGQALWPSSSGKAIPELRNTLIERIRKSALSGIDDYITTILGTEGSGKSWAAAIAFLGNADVNEFEDDSVRTLTVLLPAARFSDEPPRDIIGFVAEVLAVQTGGLASDKLTQVWRRRLHAWQDLPAPNNPRLILIVDGLNQRATAVWPNWLDILAQVMKKVSGRLVVTCRQEFFNTKICPNIETTVEAIEIPEWTDAELDKILKQESIDPAILFDESRDVLRNPRLLRIALALLDEGRITDLNGLSRGFLYFSHIASAVKEGRSTTDTHLIARELSDHAMEIIDRITSQKTESVYEFDSFTLNDIEQRLRPLTEEQFFALIAGDPTRYNLNDNGMLIAFSLLLKMQMMKTGGNGDDLSEHLKKLLEPIVDLEFIGDAVLAAAQICAIDPNCPDVVVATLIACVLDIQNLNRNAFDILYETSRNNLRAAFRALKEDALATRCSERHDWLVSIVSKLSMQERYCDEINLEIKQWLQFLCVKADRGGLGANPEEGETKQQAATKLIAKRLEALSDAERKCLEKCERTEHGTFRLSYDAFSLLSRNELAEFAEEFVCWSLEDAVNPSLNQPSKHFRALIQHNLRDWEQTKKALLEEARFLREKGTSESGRWALIEILRAIGDTQSSSEASDYVAKLRPDHEHQKGWRLIEDYWDTDPCDPDAFEPTTLNATTDKYFQLEKGPFRQSRGMTAEDHFVDRAMPGFIRFAQDRAKEWVNETADEILDRSEEDEAKFGVRWLRDKHAGGLSRKCAKKFVSKGMDLGKACNSTDGKNDKWWLWQWYLEVGFPHLDADDQVDVFIEWPDHPALLSLFELIRPLLPHHVEKLIAAAQESTSENGRIAMLAAAYAFDGPIPQVSIPILKTLVHNNSSVVRGEVFGLINKSEHKNLIEEFLSMGWSARIIDPNEKKGIECRQGVALVVIAAKLQFLPIDEAFSRIFYDDFGYAISVLGKKADKFGAAYIDQAIRRVCGAVGSVDTVEKNLPGIPKIDGKAASQILQGLDRHALKVLVDSYSELLREWARKIANPASKFPHRVYSLFTWGLAETISHIDPDLGLSLIQSNKVDITAFSGLSKYLTSMWRLADTEEIDQFRTERLSNAASDLELADEILAAIIAGKQDKVLEIAEAMSRENHPERRARAIMIAGFCDPCDRADTLITSGDNQAGIICWAYHAAKYAYERNVWARHWRKIMMEAESAEVFWSAYALYSKVADQRVQFASEFDYRPGSVASNFLPLIEHTMDQRIKKWRDKREKSLFGKNKPDAIFVGERG